MSHGDIQGLDVAYYQGVVLLAATRICDREEGSRLGSRSAVPELYWQ